MFLQERGSICGGNDDCVQQLLQLHELLEKGGISKEQYDEMQSTIMGDVKKELMLIIASIHNV